MISVFGREVRASFLEAFNKSIMQSGPAGQHRETLKGFHLLWSPPLSQHYWGIASWVIPQHNCYFRISTYCLTCGPLFLTTIPRSLGNWTSCHATSVLPCGHRMMPPASWQTSWCRANFSWRHGAQEAGYQCTKILLHVRWKNIL